MANELGERLLSYCPICESWQPVREEFGDATVYQALYYDEKENKLVRGPFETADEGYGEYFCETCAEPLEQVELAPWQRGADI